MKKNILMKNLFLPLLCIFICINSETTFGASIKLNDAIKSKKINCVIHGNGASTHYLEPIILEVSNASNEIISVSIETGDMFIPSDSNKQNIVVTASELLVLQPKTIKTLKIKGMCTEQNDGAGSDVTLYTLKPVNDEKLRKLSTFISDKKYQTSAAQYAVWSLMNDDDINSIYSSDSTEEKELKKFMASLTGKTYPIKIKDYKTNYYAPPKEKVGGMFEYSFTQAEDIQIAMFDKNGILVRELFNQRKVAAGAHKINFEYDSSVYTDDIYYFKLIVGNEVMVNRKWDAQAMRDAFKKKIENRE